MKVDAIAPSHLILVIRQAGAFSQDQASAAPIKDVEMRRRSHRYRRSFKLGSGPQVSPLLILPHQHPLSHSFGDLQPVEKKCLSPPHGSEEIRRFWKSSQII